MINKDFDMREYIDIINESNETDMLMEEIINELGFAAAKSLIKHFKDFISPAGATIFKHGEIDTPALRYYHQNGLVDKLKNKTYMRDGTPKIVGEPIDIYDPKVQGFLKKIGDRNFRKEIKARELQKQFPKSKPFTNAHDMDFPQSIKPISLGPDSRRGSFYMDNADGTDWYN